MNTEPGAKVRDWTIGIVGEGPTDYVILNGLIRSITGCTRDCLRIQPEKPLSPGGFPGGWKGVARWCQKKGWKADKMKEPGLEAAASGGLLLDGVPLDLLILHLDGDVSRGTDNRAVHCLSGCLSAQSCTYYGKADPLRCVVGDCPVESPCPCHELSVLGYSGHLRGLLHSLLNAPEQVRERVCPVIPCDSTEAWIVAAVENRTDAEQIINPWETVILKKKKTYSYRGSKKHESDYRRQFLPVLLDRWETVKTLCSTARQFENDLLAALGLDLPSGV